MPFTASQTRSEPEVSPKASLLYDWSDDVSFYFTWVKGFRAGGFNEFALNGNPENLTYDSERTTSWELGTKARLLDGTAQVSLGLFWMNLVGFQVLTQDPANLDQKVENAGEARARGIEADATWFPSDWLSIVGALGMNDSEFLDFPLGTCSADRQNTDGDADGRCDQTGEPLFRAPKWTVTLAPTVDLPMPFFPLAGIAFIGGLVGEYHDTQRLAPEGPDRRLHQRSFFRFGGNVGLKDVARGWTVRVTAQNLTDEFTSTRISATPVLPATFWGTPEKPRFVYGEIRWEF